MPEPSPPISLKTKQARRNQQEPPWKKISSHWIVGIVGSIGVSYEGAQEVSIRCAVLGILFVWLTIDSWIMLAAWKRGRWKAIGVTLTLVLASVFGGSAYAIYENGINKKEEALRQGLTIQQGHQSDSSDPFSTSFSIRNVSPFDIAHTKAGCITSDMQYLSGTHVYMDLDVRSQKSFDYPLISGGDAETYKCASPLGGRNGDSPTVRCADITVVVAYSDGPGWKNYRDKRVRFVTHADKDGMHWYEQNLMYPYGMCTGIELPHHEMYRLDEVGTWGGKQ